MKKIILGSILLLLFVCATGQTLDSAFRRIEKVEKVQQELAAQISTVKSQPGSPQGNSAAAKPATVSPGNCAGQTTSWLLPLIPIALFIAAAVFLIVRLGKSGFKISDALSSYRQNTRRTVTKTFSGTTPASQVEQETSDDQPVRSTSRTLALLTGVVALIIAITLTSYLGYRMVSGCGTDVSLDSFWKILMGLGIGVIPYGANVLGGNSKENPKPPAVS